MTQGAPQWGYHGQQGGSVPSPSSFGKKGAIQNLHNPPRAAEVQMQARKARAFHGALDQQVCLPLSSELTRLQMQQKQQMHQYQQQNQQRPRQRLGSDVYIYDMRTESSGTSLDIGGPPRQATPPQNRPG